MAFGRRKVAVLLLLFMVVSAVAVPVTRSLKTIGSFHSQDVKEIENDDVVLDRRMAIELTDYPGTGANHNHDPRPPGKA